jgi:hypothetical protein
MEGRMFEQFACFRFIGENPLRSQSVLEYSITHEVILQAIWNLHFCQALPWHKVARIDVRVPGYTVGPDQTAFTGGPGETIGNMYQFGYRGIDARSVPVTRNEVGPIIHTFLGRMHVPRLFLHSFSASPEYCTGNTQKFDAKIIMHDAAHL